MDKNRILLIDNEEGLCRMIEAVLGDNGYTVESFTSPFTALESFEPGSYDLVISDIKMPGMDGLEVLQKIRARISMYP
jgi:CheY-like chemotaxis protein